MILPLALVGGGSWIGYRWFARPRLLAEWARDHGKGTDAIEQLLP